MSDFPDPYTPPGPSSSPPPRGWPTWVKACLVLSGLGATSLVCCCGGLWYLGSKTIQMKPPAVRAVADQIITMDIGEPWQPQMAMDLWVVRMVFFVTDKQDLLVLLDTAGEETQDRDRLERELRAKLDAKVSEQAQFEPLNVVQSGERTYQIRGQPVTFHFNHCEGAASREPYYEVSGVCDGNERTACIYLRVRQGTLEEDEIRSLIESIR